jgi:ceramide glucosyltransferase
MVARFLGVADFALGSTMVFRAETLRQIGGFERLTEYLADDYQLGRKIAATGLRVAFADTVVETHLSGATWGEVWRHQLRWTRTVRISRPRGYCGYAVTHATVWSLLALARGAWWPAALAMSARFAAAVVIGRFVLQDRSVLSRLWLVPVRDIWGFGAWLAGLFGNVVQWNNEQLLLSSDGRIIGKRAL